jgi:hypothetical protein
MSQPNKLRIPLRVVFYREADSWIAHCLEFDLIGDGPTKEAALDCLNKAIAIQFDASKDFDNGANLFTPADGEFFQRYAAGIDISHGELVVRLEDFQLSAPIIQDINVREYQDSLSPALA